MKTILILVFGVLLFWTVVAYYKGGAAVAGEMLGLLLLVIGVWVLFGGR